MTSSLEDFWRVEARPDGIIWCTRSSRPYLSVTMLDEVLVLLHRRLEPVHRPTHSLLLDLRASPIVTQGEWMSGALLHHRRRLVRGFRRAGFLVRSPEQGDPIPRPSGPECPEIQLFRDPDRARGAMRFRGTAAPEAIE
jgi:hypothetical protein